MRYRAIVQYDGTDFAGWQKQPEKRTVQSEIEKALKNLTQQDIMITGAGRTDAGVHALNQVFHFDCDRQFTDITRAINSQLPADVHVLQCEECDGQFHARYDACWKQYRYLINCSQYNPITRNYIWQYCRPLDVDGMRKAAEIFVGTHDFTSFNATRSSEVEDQVRTIYELEIEEYNGIVEFTVSGDGFLRHMVRMIVASLVEVGKGALSCDQLAEILAARDKNACNFNIPGCGLYLVTVEYSKFVL